MGYFKYAIKVRFSEVGTDNHLTSKGFMRYMQEAASMHSESLGYGLTNNEKNHLTWVIANWKLQIFDNPPCGTDIIIKTWARSLVKFYSYRDFEVYDNSGKLLAIATSKWILLNSQTKSIIRIPENMLNDYDPIDKCVFKEKMDEKNKGEISNCVYEYNIQRRDLDTNHHVNNLVFLDYAMETLPEDVFMSCDFKNIEIIYKKEILYKSTIKCFYCFKNNKHIITIKNDSLDVTHAIITLY